MRGVRVIPVSSARALDHVDGGKPPPPGKTKSCIVTVVTHLERMHVRRQDGGDGCETKRNRVFYSEGKKFSMLHMGEF